MGREVRMVPADWEHPKKNGRYVPLFDDLVGHLRELAQWERGFVADYKGGWKAKDPSDGSAEDYFGPTHVEEYMPVWPPEACTHLQMYETTTEGTPISPPMPTAEDLARWLADNGASAFASDTATYEQWLSACRRGSAPSACIAGGVMMSGVEACAK